MPKKKLVYILSDKSSYEPEPSIIGIYSTMEKAQNRLLYLVKEYHYPKEDFSIWTYMLDENYGEC